MKEPENPNQLWTPNSWRTIRDPWNNNKYKQPGPDATPFTPIDFVGRDYAENYYNLDVEGIDSSRRDALIESIIEVDNTRKEYIKRLIIEESRIDILMLLLGYRAPAHQLIINDFFKDRQFGLALAPRGSGKSTCCNICYSVMRAIQDRNIRILIASRTMEQAQAFLFEIKANLEKESITEIFGNLRGDKWDETQAAVAGRTAKTKEQTFTTVGADGAVVSKHFDLIIPDDLVEDKNSRTEGQRDQLKRFFYRSLLPCLRPSGEMRILGTRYNPEDLYGHLTTNDPKFKKSYFILPAIFDKKTGESVSIEQDEAGKFIVPKNATCYDPEGYPMQKILDRRASMSLHDFECQYQNRVEFMRGDFFDIDWFKYYTEDPLALIKKHDLAVWMGVDLASSMKSSADEFAIVVIGVIKKIFEIYVLYTFAGRLTFNQQKQRLVEVYDMFNPIRTFVEANAYQSVLESTTREEFPDIRTSPVWTTQDKITRARTLQLYYERGQMFHRKGRMAKLEGQLIGFPNVKLKDLFDAEYLAVNGSLHGVSRKRRRKEDEPGLF